MPSLSNSLRQTKVTPVLLANPLAKFYITYPVVFYYRRFEQERQVVVKKNWKLAKALLFKPLKPLGREPQQAA